MVALFNLEQPHNALMTVLSLFPLSSPMVMVVRLSAGGVAAWQPVLSVAILCATVAVAIWSGARLFRAQNLLSGEHFSIRRVLQALAT
jgi:ABC-2 type transport system permease protein